MTNIVNVEMAAAWDGPEGAHFAEQASRYERATQAHTRRLLAALDLRPGHAVLDVGCGAGCATNEIARLVQPGAVLGIDLSTALLTVAENAAREQRLANVRFEHADAQVHSFEPPVFDLGVSSFGAMFFNDPVAAFANIRGALRPGARLVLLAWRGLAENEWLTEFRRSLAAGRPLPTPPPNVPGPFGLADPTHARGVLTAAGFATVDVESVDEPIVLGTDPEDAFAFVSTMGLTRGLLADLDDQRRKEALEELHATLTRHATTDGVELATAAWLITATTEGELT